MEEKDKNKEHKDQVKEELDETIREKRKFFGFKKNLGKGIDQRKRAMFGGKFTHGTRGKPGHGPRGNQG
ncbi:MAG: hypothetical protein HQ572_05675 [Candidatus Omnitrophica bacterium]|nr:hypothetical protein [Candidatus Omnitrophota bacterium]